MKKAITFTAGCAINKEMYYMACAVDDYDVDEPHTVMCFYQDQTSEKWFYHELPEWRVISTTFPCPPPDSVRVVYALDENGRVEAYSKNGSEITQIPNSGLDHSRVGYATRIRSINGALYVCGTNGQVYRRHKENWLDSGQGLAKNELDATKLNAQSSEDFFRVLDEYHDGLLDLVDINGTSENDLYVVGTDGVIAHHKDGEWKLLEKITGAHLNSIFIVAPDDVIIVGDHGTVLRGNAADGFRVIFRKNSNFNLYGAAAFGGSIYLASSNGLYLLKDDLNQVEEEMFFDKEILEVEEKDGVLWILCEKFLARFNGKNFEYFFHPNNQQ